MLNRWEELTEILKSLKNFRDILNKSYRDEKIKEDVKVHNLVYKSFEKIFDLETLALILKAIYLRNKDLEKWDYKKK